MKLAAGDSIECRDRKEMEAVGKALESRGYEVEYVANTCDEYWIKIIANKDVKI